MEDETAMTGTLDVILRQVRLLRLVSIVGAGAAAAVLQAVVGSWAGLVLAVLAAAAWIVARAQGQVRRLIERAGQEAAETIAQASFVVLGVLMVWRLAFAWLPLAIPGAWLLVCAMDLDRLATRFPLHTSRLVQRSVVRTHLLGLALLAAASAGAGIVASVVTIRLQLFAVVLLAVLLVLLVRHITAGITQSDNRRSHGGNNGRT
jgi:hypothetical protein